MTRAFRLNGPATLFSMVHRSGASARHVLRTLTLTSIRVGQYRSRRVMAGEVS